MSLAMALGSLIGIAGSTMFPHMVKCCGLHITALIGFTMELLALLPCVIALWLPGSLFELYSGASLYLVDETTDATTEIYVFNETDSQVNYTIFDGANQTISDVEKEASTGKVYTSVAVMLGGIIAARFGKFIIISQRAIGKIWKHKC